MPGATAELIPALAAPTGLGDDAPSFARADPRAGGTDTNAAWSHRRARRRGEKIVARWLLVLPFLGLLWVPLYNGTDPVLFGFPLFYWYQLGWVPLSMLVTWLAWRGSRR